MFNIGDIVKLKTGLIPNKEYGNLTYLNGMTHYANKALKIINRVSGENYVVEECKYVFSGEMLEIYNEEQTNSSITHNFKIGDIVTIRTDLIPNNLYQGLLFMDRMSIYKGHAFKIKTIEILPNAYTLETLDGSRFWFTEEMFEKIPKIKKIYDSKSEQIDEAKKNIITMTEVIINPCKKEIYTL